MPCRYSKFCLSEGRRARKKHCDTGAVQCFVVDYLVKKFVLHYTVVVVVDMMEHLFVDDKGLLNH